MEGSTFFDGVTCSEPNRQKDTIMQEVKKIYIPPQLTTVSFVVENGLNMSATTSSPSTAGDQVLLDQSSEQNTEFFNWHWNGN